MLSSIAEQDKKAELLKKEIINKKTDLAKKYKELQKNNHLNDNDLNDDYASYFNNEINTKNQQIDKLRLLMEMNDNLDLDLDINNNNNNEFLKKELIHDQKELMNEIEKISKEIKNVK